MYSCHIALRVSQNLVNAESYRLPKRLMGIRITRLIETK